MAAPWPSPHRAEARLSHDAAAAVPPGLPRLRPSGVQSGQSTRRDAPATQPRGCRRKAAAGQRRGISFRQAIQGGFDVAACALVDFVRPGVASGSDIFGRERGHHLGRAPMNLRVALQVLRKPGSPRKHHGLGGLCFVPAANGARRSGLGRSNASTTDPIRAAGHRSKTGRGSWLLPCRAYAHREPSWVRTVMVSLHF
jgi:hypothetical protein